RRVLVRREPTRTGTRRAHRAAPAPAPPPRRAGPAPAAGARRPLHLTGPPTDLGLAHAAGALRRNPGWDGGVARRQPLPWRWQHRRGLPGHGLLRLAAQHEPVLPDPAQWRSGSTRQ